MNYKEITYGRTISVFEKGDYSFEMKVVLAPGEDPDACFNELKNKVDNLARDTGNQALKDSGYESSGLLF